MPNVMFSDVPEWTIKDLEERVKYLKPPISVSGRAIIRKAVLSTEGNKEIISKSTDPAKFLEYKSNIESTTEEGGPKLAGEMNPYSPSHDYTKEAYGLHCLSSSGIVPKIIALAPKRNEIIMEFCPGDTLSSKLLDIERREEQQHKESEEQQRKESEEQQRKEDENSDDVGTRPDVDRALSNERGLKYLGRFYAATRTINEQEIERLRRNYKQYLLRPWDSDEQKAKCSGIFLRMVLGSSREFKSNPRNTIYYENLPKNPKRRKELWVNAKREIKRYLKTKGIDFDLFVNDFIRYYNYVMYNSATITANNAVNLAKSGRIRLIHGDYIPSNIIYDSEKRAGYIVDFNELRFGSPAEDIASLLYNVYNRRMGESRAPKLIQTFWEMNDNGIKKNAFPGGLRELILAVEMARAVRDCRICASNYSFTSIDMKRFSTGVSDYKGWWDFDKKKDVFRIERIKDLEKMMPFYIHGDGQKIISPQHGTEEYNGVKPSYFTSALNLLHHLMSTTHMTSEEPPPYRGKII